MIDRDLPELSPAKRGPSAVSRDMAAIFADLRASPASGRPAAAVAPIAPLERVHRRKASALLGIAVVLAGAALAGGTMLAGRGSWAGIEPRPIERVTQASLTPPPLSAPPVSSPVAGEGPSPATGLDAAQSAPAAAPPSPRAERAPAPAAQRVPSPTLARAAARPARPWATRQRVRSGPGLAERKDNCANKAGEDRARCMYPEILQGDDALRRAYADAVTAGVSARTLSPLRNRWARLRPRSLADPDEVAAGYRQLTRELQALRADEAGAGAEAGEPRFADGF